MLLLVWQYSVQSPTQFVVCFNCSVVQVFHDFIVRRIYISLLTASVIHCALLLAWLWVQKGRLSEAKGDLVDAKRLYESSVAISPTHIKSLHRLVSGLGLGLLWDNPAIGGRACLWNDLLCVDWDLKYCSLAYLLSSFQLWQAAFVCLLIVSKWPIICWVGC